MKLLGLTPRKPLAQMNPAVKKATAKLNRKPLRASHYFHAAFEKESRSRLKLRKVDPAYLVFLDDLVVSQDERLVLVKNPKAGCTTITRALYEYSYGRPPKNPIHSVQDGFRQGLPHWEKNFPVLMQSDSFRMTSVRDPLRRAVSAFRNFFVDQTNVSRHIHTDAIVNFGFSPDLPMEQRFDIYLDYVEASFAQDEMWTDRHWRLQVHNIAFGKIDYDIILRVENLQEDLSRIPDLAGFKDSTGAFSKGLILNASPPSQFFPTAQQTARVFKLYQRDYEAFRYPCKAM